MHKQKELTHSETTPFFFDIVRQCELFPVQMAGTGQAACDRFKGLSDAYLDRTLNYNKK